MLVDVLTGFSSVVLPLVVVTAATTTSTYADRDVYFSAPLNSQYTASVAENDWGNVRGITQTDRLKINSSGHLVFDMPTGGVGPANSGGQVLAWLTVADSYTLEYRVMFDGITTSYDWTTGGKLPGLGGGVMYTGGNPAWAGDGFSVRLMFKPNGRLIPYVYHKDQPAEYGNTFGASVGTLTSGTWNTVKIFAKANTGSNFDGVLKIYVNSVQTFVKSDIRYATAGVGVDTLHLTAFHGGSSPDYAPSHDQRIKFDWVKVHHGEV